MKPKRGRPPKPPEESKGEVYQLRLSEAERAEYQKAADRAEMLLAAWMRDRLSKAAKREAR